MALVDGVLPPKQLTFTYQMHCLYLARYAPSIFSFFFFLFMVLMMSSPMGIFLRWPSDIRASKKNTHKNWWDQVFFWVH